SPFRGFHFRHSNKRARSPAPASLPQPTSPAVVNQDGIVEHEMISPDKNSAVLESGHGPAEQGTDARDQPMIPAFLAMSEQEILSKYSEITWTERNRTFQAMTNQSPTFKYARVDSVFKTLDRYGNIQPYNNNRVKLQVPEGAPDYINASPIVLHSPLNPDTRLPHKYIAMQGPTSRTIGHVWRMVGEQLASPAVIVMLTETYENNMEKCYPYFPHLVDETIEVGEEDEFQDGFRAQVKCVDVEEKADGAIMMRKLSMHVEGQEDDLEVWHLLYKKWPDFGVPALEDIDSFFELMRLSRSKNASEDNPRIVHCSAGVGRSGTFIALEHLMREVDSGDLERYDGLHETAKPPDLVFETVGALREQRKMMVQAEPQYLFIYQVLRKLWMGKYGIEDDAGGEPAAKRLEIGHDPFVDE
ncbi:protein-tyrosine phosphatase-like protein, partial [Xylariales sp. AK1849]